MKKLLISTLFALATMGSAAAQAPAAPELDKLWLYVLGGVLVVGAGAFVFRMSKSKDTPANAPLAAAPKPPKPAGPPPLPGIFDAASFLDYARGSFVRMQAAWDKADSNDLRQFTTEQVFAELNAQIAGRGDTGERTEVVSIAAELLGVEARGDEHHASVKFDGMIKPGPDAPAQPFSEVWNMSKPLAHSSGWKLSGIQQLS